MYMYDRPFQWWVQSVMPLVFDDSLSYYEVLAKLTKYIEGLTGDVEQIEKILETIEGIKDITQFTEFLEKIQSEIGNLENLQTDTKANLVSAINEVALKADIAYSKPPKGIPESDLSQSVQDKLNRTGEATEYIINNKTLKKAPNNNSPADLGLGTYSVPSGGIPWDTLSQDVRDRIDAGGSGTGGTKDYTELINKPQINGHTLNAGNNTTESLGLGTYSKPSRGIPESDLSAEVQEKLNTSGGIADSEAGFIATRDYVAGELVYINGVLYRVKYDILAGTNLVPGNNIEVTDINAELEKINSDIDALQSGAGPDSWNLTDTVQSYSYLEKVDFFEYFNCIGGENYNFIVEPTDPSNAVSYHLDICKRDGTVVLSQHVTETVDYTNRKRFTFVPVDSGEYYCKFYRNASGYDTTISAVKVTIEYTQSQGISELWNQVNKATQLEPRVDALETLAEQQTQDINDIKNNDIGEINEIISNINGDNDIVETPFEGEQTQVGITVYYDEYIKVYGTSTAARYFTCFDPVPSFGYSTTVFNQTIDKGCYRVHINVSGTVPTNYRMKLNFTAGTFADGTAYKDGDLVVFDEPQMVGLLLQRNVNYGTEENPCIINAYLEKYVEKADKEDLDDLRETCEKIIEANERETNVLAFTHDGRAVQGIVVDDITENYAKIYGTSTSTNIRVHRIFNSLSHSVVASTTNPPKAFAPGKYRFVFSFSGFATIGTNVRFKAITAGIESGFFITNGEEFEMESAFTIVLSMPGSMNFGTEENPTYLSANLFTETLENADCVYPTGDMTDRKGDIESVLNMYRVCHLAHGYYYVSGIDMLHGSTLIGDGIGTKIVLLDSVAVGYAIKMGSKCSIRNCEIIGASEEPDFTNGDIESIHIGTRHGILWKGEATGDTSTSNDNRHFEGMISGCYINNFSGGGITCESTGYKVNSGITVDNCEIDNCGAGINVSWWSEFNRFSNMNIKYCYYGCINNGGNNSFVNCNFSGNNVGFYMNGMTGKCVLYDGNTNTARNSAHGIAVGCMIEHSGLGENTNTGYAIYLRAFTPGFIFSACNIYYGHVFVKNAQKILFSNCQIGSGAILVIYPTNSTVIFIGGYVHDSLVAYVYADDDTIVPESSYDSSGNLPHAKLLNMYSFTGTSYSLKFIASDTPET